MAQYNGYSIIICIEHTKSSLLVDSNISGLGQLDITCATAWRDDAVHTNSNDDLSSLPATAPVRLNPLS